jgi:GT2 family glycosyltransferase
LKEIAVVILNWNGKRFLEQFLPKVIEYSQQYAEVIIADNNSTDGSVELLEQNFPKVKIIQNSFNAGFASGYNLALQKVKAKYYVLLNSDVEVTENWIRPLIDFMEQDDNIAACQPKIRSYFNKEKFEYAGAAGGYIDKYGYPFCRGRLFQSIETDTGQYNDVCEIFWATGACLFIKADKFHEVGGFDDDFFAHMEEIDLCWRLKNMGYKIMYSPLSIIYHVGGGTLPKTSSQKTYFNFRNNFFLLYKNLPSNRLWKMFLSRLLLDGIAGAKFLFQGDYKDLWAIIKAHLSFYKNLEKLYRKRKLLTQKKVSMVYLSNVAFDHYLWRLKRFSQMNPDKFSKL